MSTVIGLLAIALLLFFIFRTILGMVDDAKKRAEKKAKEIDKVVSDSESASDVDKKI